jgi:hypothetical protein
MFRSSLNRLLDWAEGALAPEDEHLGAADDRAPAPPPLRHPHRRELRWERQRRPGSLPHPPAHCISPVGRRVSGSRERDASTR